MDTHKDAIIGSENDTIPNNIAGSANGFTESTRGTVRPIALPKNPVVAIVGATGAVGEELLLTLVQRNFPARRVVALASSRSAGKKIPFDGPGNIDGYLEVEELTTDSFDGIDLAFFSAGGSISEAFAPEAVKRGAVVIDNSSAFRMVDEVPLVVPEVNPQDAFTHKGIIANPNCSTIQMVVALEPLHKLAPIKRVVVSTYQAASGAGAAAMAELTEQTAAHLEGRDFEPRKFAHRLAFNCIPHIDVFLEDGSTKEEWKMVVETKKIMHAPNLEVHATCVRVPVLRCHAESVNVEFSEAVTLSAARSALASAPGITLMDNPEANEYPMPGFLESTDDTYVGRLRKDATVESGLSMWVVADQIRKGAALNAIQIGELLLSGSGE